MADSHTQPPEHQGGETDHPEQQTREQAKRRPIEVAIVSQVPPTPSAGNKSYGSSEDKTPRWKKILEHSAIALAFVVALIYGGQLWVMRQTLAQMKTSGEATTQQMWSAITNMNWMAKSMDESLQRLSEQTSNTHALAEAAKRQADNTRTLAEQGKVALHVTERAYIMATAPDLFSNTQRERIIFSNVGRIPSGALQIITHVATINVERYGPRPDLGKAVERHWFQTNVEALAPGPGLGVSVPLGLVSETKMQQGLQTIVIAGKFRYEDGFPDDGTQNGFFGFQTLLLTEEKRVVWRGLDPRGILPKMEALDGYPKNGQRE